MNNKIVMVAIGATVGILMVASLLMPIINDAVDDSRVYFNNNYTSMAKVVGDESMTIAYDGVSYTINDEPVTIESYTYVSISDKFVILVTDSGQANLNYYSESFVKADGVTSFEMVINDNVVNLNYTLEGTTTTTSFDIGWAYYVYSDGEYRLFKVDQYNTRSIYVNSINDLVAINYGYSGILSLRDDVVEYNGTIRGDYHADLTTINGVNDVYQMIISSESTTSDFYFIDNDENLTTQAFIVPFEVHGHKDGFKGVDSVLLAIPLIVILAFVVAFASLIRSRD